MTKRESINQFLNHKNIAIVGVSSDPKKYSRMVYNAFLTNGYNVAAVNPKIRDINGTPCYASLKELPNEVDSVIIIVKGEKARDILDEAISKGIKNIWLHQGCTLKDEQISANQKDINIIKGECSFMWLEPVEGFHKFHKFFKYLFSKN